MEYFISDTHFYHYNIIQYCDRPFDNIEEMNNKMIESWNSIVTQSDTVYSLVNVDENMFISGSWDKTIKIWKY